MRTKLVTSQMSVWQLGKNGNIIARAEYSLFYPIEKKLRYAQSNRSQIKFFTSMFFFLHWYSKLSLSMFWGIIIPRGIDKVPA